MGIFSILLLLNVLAILLNMIYYFRHSIYYKKLIIIGNEYNSITIAYSSNPAIKLELLSFPQRIVFSINFLFFQLRIEISNPHYQGRNDLFN